MPDASCLVVIDSAASGEWNMAVDAALLEEAVSKGICAVRWYQWSEPTVSLGYFQTATNPDQRSSQLPAVRRLTGGGAIIHDRELTYSCVLPASHPLSRTPRELYTVIHESIATSLRSRGFPVTIRGNSHPEKSAEFLCFGRGDEFDLVVNDTKVLGSAQRRRKGAVLQHGSLVLAASDYAPQFPGLRDLSPSVAVPDLQEWLLELGTSTGKAVSDKLRWGSLPESVKRRAAEIPPSIFHLT